jgi:hypothetical protein
MKYTDAQPNINEWDRSKREVKRRSGHNDKTEREYISTELQDVTAQNTAVFKDVKTA